MRPLFEVHDLSKISGRVLAVGDIHGMFPLLRSELRRLRYNPQHDRLVMLGDLVDRGPASAESIQWCGVPDVLRVRGNHEEFTHFSVVTGDGCDGYLHVQHIRNGGRWFYDLPFDQRERFAEALCDVPIAMEVKTPGGHTVGFVHAEVPGADWSELKRRLVSARTPYDDALHMMTWGGDMDRQPPTRVMGCANIGHVIFGHSAIPIPLRRGNCTWIDTGAHGTGNLTIIDVDEWLKK